MDLKSDGKEANRMARAKMRLRRIDNGIIYRAANASTVRRLLPQQQSPRCFSVLIVRDESCSLSRNIPEVALEKIREAIEALKTMLDQHRSESLELWINKMCDGLNEAGKGKAGRFCYIRCWKLNSFPNRRPWYKKQIRFAEWYREGPPNNQRICHTIMTAA